jgi:hypothetical protein
VFVFNDEIFERFSPEELLNLELISKWGCDGSQQDQYKQKLQDDTDSDAFIFQSSFVPLKLVSNLNNGKKKHCGQIRQHHRLDIVAP